MTEITIDNLTKIYGSRQDGELAVDNVSFTIEDGEFAIIVGPSGCGKTTLLRCIAGLESPTDGRILFDDEDITNEIPQRRNVAMVFQNLALYAHMTARDNIAYPLKLRSVPPDQRDARIKEAARILQISDHLEDSPMNLSGGQQQRVSLARCLVQQPRVFLFDEPTSNLDAKLQIEIRKEIMRVSKQTGQTMIFVTHNQEEAMTMADRIIVMNDGQVEQIGKPEEVYENPNNTFVGSFIGTPTMNLFEGEKRGATFEMQIGELALGEASTLPDGQYLLGFRPDKARFESGGGKHLRAEVDLIELTGVNTIITTQTTQGELRILSNRKPQIREGEQINVNVPPEDIYLFDTETGESLTTRMIEAR